MPAGSKIRAFHRNLLWVVVLIVLAICFTQAKAADTAADENWPQWRGPLGNGIAPKADPPTNWSATSHLKWQTPLPGEGTSTPIIWDDRIFVQAAINTGHPGAGAVSSPAPAPQGGRRGRGGFGGGAAPAEAYQFVVLCIDRKTGKSLWQQVAREEVPHEGRHQTEGSFASPSPVTDGSHLYAFFGSRGLYCYDMDGHLQWSQDLGKMRIFLTFGEGSSPALWGDLLIINWDNEEGSFITALDKKTGKTVWRTPRDEKTAWATPLVVDSGGKAQVITTATSKTRSYDVQTGKLIWEGPGLTRNVIPSPVAGDGIVYAISGYQGHSALAIKLDRTGNIAGSDAIVWSYNKKTPYVPSPLLYLGKFYFFADNNEILTVLDAKTGQPIIDGQRMDDMAGVYASPVAAAGRVYLVSRNGTVLVMQDGGKPQVIATNHLEDKFDASPALAGKDLILRGLHTLYCLSNQ